MKTTAGQQVREVLEAIREAEERGEFLILCKEAQGFPGAIRVSAVWKNGGEEHAG